MHKEFIIVGLFLGIFFLLLAAKPLISPTLPFGQPLSLPGGRFPTQQESWKTHTNSKYGHQFMFPANWQVEEWDIEQAANLKNVADGTILHQGSFFTQTGSPVGRFEVLIWENKSRASTRQWLTWYRHEDLILKDIPQENNFIIAGLPALRFLQQETSKKKPILYIFFAKDDKIYELTEEREDLIGAESSENLNFTNPVYDKILESFQFVVR